TIYGDGSQTRSLCYVTDLVRGIYALMESDLDLPTNIGNPQELTILEIAQRVCEIAGAPLQLEHHPMPENDPKVRRPDTERAQTHLDWKPNVNLEWGLEQTLKYFRDLRSEGR